MKTLQRGLFKVSGDTVNTLSMLILTLYNVFNKLKSVFNYSKFIYPEVTWLCQKCSLILFVYYTIHICWLTSTTVICINQLLDFTYYDGKISILIWILLSGIKSIIQDKRIKLNVQN